MSTVSQTGPRIGSILDIEARAKAIFPDQLQEYALKHANSIHSDLLVAASSGSSRSSKKKMDKIQNTNLIPFPVGEIHSILVKEILGYKIDLPVTAYLLAILDYVASDIFKLSGNYINHMRSREITRHDIRVAIEADRHLMDLFYPDEDVYNCNEDLSSDNYMSPLLQAVMSSSANKSDGYINSFNDAISSPTVVPAEPPTYDECVKDLIHEEQQFIKDLNLIIKVC